uniref:RNA polymerase II subunit A C-terminal domain phosphatase n=1 Tax=Caenorhabditis tropicalis TaxID=1561998 RepID=A0A1I7T199_9PELO
MEIKFESNESECTAGIKKASEGSFVMKDAVLLEFKVNGSVAGRIKTPSEGVVTFTKGLKIGSLLKQGQVIATVSECTHAIVIKDMCATCGKDLREKGGRAGQRKEQSTANVSMIHHVPELIVSDSLAQELGSADENNLITNRKLVLLVDLDQTIIHTSDKPMTVDAENHKDLTKYNLHSRVYTTKLRPHTTEFLNKMSTMYEMHIVTYGQRQYAHKIAKILDPDARLFGQRILSRDELFSAQHKTRNLKALFPCGDNFVVIIDDRADVWMYSDALIQIKPYRFFKEVGDINAPKNSKEQMPVQIEDDAHEDRVLEEIERVLTNIHDKYYEKYDLKETDKLDVKDVIKEERKKVLDGCVIVFSGIVPTGEKLERTDIYRLCDQFGAKILPEVTDEVTHVVGARYGTQKIHQALRLGKFVVTVQWVYACVEKWIKADEKLFELTKESTPPIGRPLGSKYVNDLANMDTIGKAALADMNNEVDEALSDEDEDEGDDDDEDDGRGDPDGFDNNEERGNEVDKEINDDFEEEIISQDAGEKNEEKEKQNNDSFPRGQKRKHCPEMEDEEEKSDSEDEDDETPMSYKALLSRSRKEGRIVPENYEDAVFDVDDDKGHIPSTSMNDEEDEEREDNEDEDVPESDDDDEFEDMAALIERQISETADERDNEME